MQRFGFDSGSIWGSIRGRFGIDSGSIRGRFGVDSGLIRIQFGIDSVSIRGRLGVDSGSIRVRFGVDSGSNGRTAVRPLIGFTGIYLYWNLFRYAVMTVLLILWFSQCSEVREFSRCPFPSFFVTTCNCTTQYFPKNSLRVPVTIVTGTRNGRYGYP